MPLRLLHRAVIENSRNPVLQELCYFIDRYNARYSGPQQPGVKNTTTLDEQASLLGGIFYRAAAYLTSKPPEGGRIKRKLRWAAMNDLARQITAEAERAGVKLVRGPDDFRKTVKDGKNENLWLEILDPYHRHGFDLSVLYQKWLATPGNKSFWETIGTPEEVEVAYLRGELGAVSFAGMHLVGQDGQLWSTRGGSTMASGQGWQIFVVSPDGTLYINDHSASEFHHTSFLSGGAVLAAGEIVVDRGLIRCLTAKTGHYWTSPQLMLNLVRRMHEIPDDALVRPDVLEPEPPKQLDESGMEKDADPADRMIFYRVRDFRQAGLRAQRLTREEVDAVMPSFAWKARVVPVPYVNR